jgi:hypothetical protein
MLDEPLIDAYSRILALRGDEERFYSEAWRLMESLKDEVRQAFPDEIESSQVAMHWGRLGVECTLKVRPLGQWVFFGIYYHSRDHGVKFKEANQPEFAVFFDVDRNNRTRLAVLGDMTRAIAELSRAQFEFNFPENSCGNAWRVCYWRDPMRRYLDATVPDLRARFVERLQTLFASEFYRIARNAGV